ncbi:MAG: sporulation protein [Ruminococcus sp.]|nr:sporulation protein [Ruminococcus sp.]
MTEEILLAFIVSIDIYLAAAAYCNSGIRIPIPSAAAISLVGAAVLWSAVRFSAMVGRYVPAGVFHKCGIAVLTAIGVLTILKSAVRSIMRKATENNGILLKKGSIVIRLYLDDTAADIDGSKTLSVTEALSLAVVSSFDCAATGIGAGSHSLNTAVLAPAAFLCGCLALFLGNITGKKISSLKHDLSWVGGLILIIFAFVF